ncbi:MAG TPA: YncE family protein, partial [Bacteroidetes bacterium]|nr:YncE family protein [Bacteroidota bacterium]
MKYLLIGFALLLLFASSCVKEPMEPNNKPLASIDTSLATMGLYVLNEGLFNLNNSTLTWFSYADGESVTDFFEQKNGRSLGDTGNDIAIYGSKMYVVINVSSQVEVVNPFTGKSIKQIAFFNGDKPRQPRRIAFHGSKAFVCSFDGTVALIDTASLEIEQLIEVGRNPDGIAVLNNKVYVSNSGGLDAPNYDSTVSVIDIETMSEIKRIDVGLNPFSLVPDDYGNLYVVLRGN